MVALAGNKVIMPGTYQWPSQGGGYKIYQSKGPGGRLFRSYNPQILGKQNIGRGSEYAWQWSPQSDYAQFAAARKQAGKQAPAGKSTTTPATTPAATGAPATGGSAVGTALGGSGGSSSGGLASNPFLTDPGYLSALSAEQTGSQQADNALKAAQEQAIVQFGDPSLAQAAGLNISPLTAAMAQANTAAGTSTVAGLQRTRDDNQTNILDSLAAHGALDSGQTGYATTRNQQAYGQDLYGGLQTALAGLNSAAASDVSTKQGLRSDTTKALTGAYDTMVANPALWGAADTGGQKAAMNSAATAPVAQALSPNNRAGALGPKPPAPPKLAAANAYAAGTARGGRAG
jgi:hypothetical protein